MRIKKFIPWNVLEGTPFSKKVGFWSLLFILIIFSFSFYFTGRKIFLQNSYAGILLFFQIFFFGIMLKSFSGRLFNKIWVYKNGYIKNKWESLNVLSLKITYFLLYFGIVSFIILHIANFLLFYNSNKVLSYQQGAIGLVFLGLLIWFRFGKKEGESFPRQVALIYFLSMIFAIVYDSLLFEVVQITGGPPWTGRLDVPVKLSLLGVLTMIFPEFFVIFFLNIKQIFKTLGIKSYPTNN